MRSKSIDRNLPLVAVAVLGALVAGCSRPQSAAPAPEATQASEATPGAVTVPPAAEMPPLPATPEAGSVLKAAASEPELASMKMAQPASSKMGVAVDLRYQVDGDAMTGQPVTVHLAAVPRVAGTNLEVSIKPESGIEFSKETLGAQKADAGTAYRQQLRLTRLATGPRELRVLVTMDFPIGKGFTYFSVPLDGAAAPSKQPVDRLE